MSDIKFPANVEMVSFAGKFGLMSEEKLPDTISLISTIIFSGAITAGCWVTTTDTVTITDITRGALSHSILCRMRRQRHGSRKSG
jgi:hypothetical protein